MIVRLDGILCKVLYAKCMTWAWCFWWIEAARVGTDYTGYVRIGLNTKTRRQQIKQINWM